MSWAATLVLLFCQAGSAGGGGEDEGKLSPHPDRLKTRPMIPAREKDAQGSDDRKALTLLGSGDASERLRKLMGDEMLNAQAKHIDRWIGQNLSQIEQMASKSPLYDDLIVRDPALFNVVKLYLLLAMAERGQDRAYVSAAMGKRDDPAWNEWYSTYTRKLLDEIESGDRSVGEIAAEMEKVGFGDVLEDRLGKSDEELLASAKELAGVSDEDVELVEALAGTARLADEEEGRIEIDTEADGLRKKYDEKVKEIKQALERAIEQARPGSRSEVKVELDEKDRIPPEVLPTTSQLADISVMRDGAKDFHTTALARELARYAVRVAYERAATALDRMARAASGRPRTAFQILSAHLDVQRTELEQVSAAATPAAAQLRRALDAAARDRLTRLKGIQESRALDELAREKSTQPEEFGGFRQAGVDVDEAGNRKKEEYTAGEHFRGAGSDRRIETPLDRRADRHAPALTATDDPVSRAGRRGWGGGGGGGGSGMRFVCRMKDGKFVCEIVVPGQGTIQIGD